MKTGEGAARTAEVAFAGGPTLPLASAAGGETAATVGEDEAKAENPMKSPDAEAEALFSRVFRSPLPIPDVSADSKGTRRGRYLSEPQLLGIPNVILYFIFYCLPDDEIEMREIAVGYYELVILSLIHI